MLRSADDVDRGPGNGAALCVPNDTIEGRRRLGGGILSAENRAEKQTDSDRRHDNKAPAFMLDLVAVRAVSDESGL